TLANAHSADQRSAARLEPRPPRSSPVFSQNFRESQCRRAEATGKCPAVHRQRVCRALYPRAPALRLIVLPTAFSFMSPHTPHSSLHTPHFTLLTSHSSLHTPHFSLLTSHFSLLTSHFSLLTSHCLLPTAYCLLPTAYCLLPTACFLLPTACFLLSRAANGSLKCVWHPGPKPARGVGSALQGSLPAGFRPAAHCCFRPAAHCCFRPAAHCFFRPAAHCSSARSATDVAPPAARILRPCSASVHTGRHPACPAGPGVRRR
ncbi:MAG: hypothetical protein RLZZ436_1382, partial [Planctomycetota bacterium]